MLRLRSASQLSPHDRLTTSPFVLLGVHLRCLPGRPQVIEVPPLVNCQTREDGADTDAASVTPAMMSVSWQPSATWARAHGSSSSVAPTAVTSRKVSSNSLVGRMGLPLALMGGERLGTLRQSLHTSPGNKRHRPQPVALAHRIAWLTFSGDIETPCSPSVGTRSITARPCRTSRGGAPSPTRSALSSCAAPFRSAGPAPSPWQRPR